MATNITMQEAKSWRPDRPSSRGANEFHDAVINASWNHECLDELIDTAQLEIKDSDILVDFGSGTGTSAARILERLKAKISLWLVDNSPAWLTKAYEILNKKPNVSFFILEKKNDGYATLSDAVGKRSVDHVLSANTVHLIPDLRETFSGIADALKSKGTFVFNTGNVLREGREKGILLLDSTIHRVHDIAIDIIRNNPYYQKYRESLDKKIQVCSPARKFIFPDPKPLQDYIAALKDSGFENIKTHYKCFRLKYSDWINFLRIKRLQAGILPEIGGKDPNMEESKDRDDLIIISAKKLFKELERLNPFADDKSYLGEWAYVYAKKS